MARRQLYLPQILDVLAGGVPPIESSSGAGGVLLDDLPRDGVEHRHDSVSEPRARTFFFFAFERLGSIPLRAGVLGFNLCIYSPALPLQFRVEGAVQDRVYARSEAR
ncbi:hypothetical protein, partial [Arthrobacter sp. ISL-72]|uniref:hypothetical protein n=1 Tax=Arthrobacter sp. ISL-72 TaxID=2819114 RepID=UPI001BEC9E71